MWKTKTTQVQAHYAKTVAVPVMVADLFRCDITIVPDTIEVRCDMPRVDVTLYGATDVTVPVPSTINVPKSMPQPLVLTPGGTVDTSLMRMGCSIQQDGGGITAWRARRCYTLTKALEYANLSGSAKPEAIGFTDGGSIRTNYSSTFSEYTATLAEFYEGSGSSARTNVELHVANGNEYAGKSGSSPVANFVEGCRGIYDACHQLTGGGVRRFPRASAWLDPTQRQEYDGLVAASLHPACRYLDGVAWSFYPPGRGNSAATVADPTFDRPLMVESARTDLQDGFVIRCFYRTKQAVLQARTDTGNPNFKVKMACWETGIGDDPDDNRHRPYYAAHSLAWTMWQLSLDYAEWVSVFDVNMWWDQDLGAADSPQDKFSDEDPATDPSTAEAWHNWDSYVPAVGGVHPPGWPATPPASWPTGA